MTKKSIGMSGIAAIFEEVSTNWTDSRQPFSIIVRSEAEKHPRSN
jgi:hypothetical protein